MFVMGGRQNKGGEIRLLADKRNVAHRVMLFQSSSLPRGETILF